jgi:cytoskeletal protein CcmA (bactofilin family)
MLIDSPLLARGDFHAGAGCRFNQPIYVAGDCHVGKGCRLEAITVEGDLILGPGATVARWAEAGRLLDMRSGSSVAGQAIAGRSAQIGIGASAGTLTAPDIATVGREAAMVDAPRVAQSIDVPPPASGELPGLAWVRGFRLEKLSPLGAETWLYDGSLAFPVPLYLRSKLVVRGAFSCPPGSLLGDDVKAGDTLRVGQGSICKGNLAARSDLVLERDCLFEGDLSSDRWIRLASGVRGLRVSGASGAFVRVEARQALVLEPNVVVRGQLHAEQSVRGVEPQLEGGLELLLAGG